jgi:hypothetical protein
MRERTESLGKTLARLFRANVRTRLPHARWFHGLPRGPRARTLTYYGVCENGVCRAGQSDISAEVGRPITLTVSSGVHHTRASKTILKGVSLARRNWPKPPEFSTLRSRDSPACAPRQSPTSCDLEQGVQSMVENE